MNMRELVTDRHQAIQPLQPSKTGRNMSLKSLFNTTIRKVSIEVSPGSGFSTRVLRDIEPSFVSVTWLGNSHLDVSIEHIPAIVLAKEIVENNYPVVLHLAGRNLDKKRMMEILVYIKSVGIKNILALQGDWMYVLEQDDSKCDFPYASDLVRFIKSNFGEDFCVGVAAYPCNHPHCRNSEDDMKYLKLKVSSGADFLITQADFEYESLEDFANKCRRNSINVPILTGIFVIKSFKSLENVAKCCEFKVSQRVLNYVKEHQEDRELVEKFGVELAAGLIKKCLDNSQLFAGAHIFSMNDMEEVQKVVSLLA
ncbi:5,10-methylenetetrahydrofolate reductase isoform X1 [Euwallacea fornicatus]|uniref:5,10-methylenetetrahydrofolate reductase isoform X1 n=1 Tax=Euwallacea fornicatus TaxID=995702 RepID=UPI0033904F1D